MAAILLGGSGLEAQVKGSGTQKLGTVHFAVSCAPAAQQQFELALAMLHSFFFPETVKAFTAVTQTDPTCAHGLLGYRDEHPPEPAHPARRRDP